MVSSFLFGPMLAIAALSWRPSLIEAALWMAERSGTGEESLRHVLRAGALHAARMAKLILDGVRHRTSDAPPRGGASTTGTRLPLTLCLVQKARQVGVTRTTVDLFQVLA